MDEYVASLSYGKDSVAMIHVIKDILHLPLTRIITADVWATDTIPAEYPPVAEFKKKADAIIKERWGIEVEHICAMKKEGSCYGVFTKPCGWGEKLSYSDLLYTKLTKGNHIGQYKGFPAKLGEWCKRLKFNNSQIDLREYILSGFESSFKESSSRERENLWIPGQYQQRQLVYRRTQDKCFADFQECTKEIGATPNSNHTP